MDYTAQIGGSQGSFGRLIDPQLKSRAEMKGAGRFRLIIQSNNKIRIGTVLEATESDLQLQARQKKILKFL